MGQLILPSGGAISIDEFHGTTELNSLVRELKIEELTDSYRVAVIGCLARIGRPATVAIIELKKIKEGKNRILVEAATHAIGKIESDVSVPVVTPPAPTVPPPVPSSATSSTGANVHRGRSVVGKEKIKVELIPVKKSDHLFDHCPTLAECNFCHKIFDSSKNAAKFNEFLCNKEKYCRHCMRNRYYQPEISKNIVILTYRALIGYTFYSFISNKNQIYINDVREMIQDHVNVAFLNPLFNYDAETYNWFIDMNPVISKKIDIGFVGRTIATQLSALGVGEIFYRGKPHMIYQKIMERLVSGDSFIMPFPTDGGSTTDEKGIPREYLKEFISSHLADSTSTNKRKWEKKEASHHGGYCC